MTIIEFLKNPQIHRKIATLKNAQRQDYHCDEEVRH